mgnify:CR=1 FL=1
MSLNEVSLRIPTEHMANVFGQFDANIKKIERTLGVTVVVRDDQLKIIGTPSAASGAQEVFEQIKKAAPRKLYLISDGARQNRQGEAKKVAEVRGYIEAGIDWDCEVHRIYADSNMGCRGRIASGLDEVFEHEDTAIIIEDDIKPHNTFFRYCQTTVSYTHLTLPTN